MKLHTLDLLPHFCQNTKYQIQNIKYQISNAKQKNFKSGIK